MPPWPFQRAGGHECVTCFLFCFLFNLWSEQIDFCIKPDTEVNSVATWRQIHCAGICKLVGKSAKVKAACVVLKLQERKLAYSITDKTVTSFLPAPVIHRDYSILNLKSHNLSLSSSTAPVQETWCFLIWENYCLTFANRLESQTVHM